MNRSIFRLLVLPLALGLAACQPAANAPPLAGAAIGGPFAVIDQNGKPFTDADLKGRYALVYFGYTYCPDVCPVDMARLGKAMAAFEARDPARAGKVQPVFVTVDPARDTAAVVGTFVANFHPRFIGLTGTDAQIQAMLKEYRVVAQKEGDGPDYLVNHSTAAYLFGPDGKPMLLIGQDQDAAAIAAELDKWVA